MLGQKHAVHSFNTKNIRKICGERKFSDEETTAIS